MRRAQRPAQFTQVGMFYCVFATLTIISQAASSTMYTSSRWSRLFHVPSCAGTEGGSAWPHTEHDRTKRSPP